MPDSNGNSYSLTQLSDLIQAIELYYHPSNHGSWSYLLTTFARHLATEFLKRWREEQEEDCNTPKEFRLTEKLRKEFVLILRPVTYLSMFGKDQYTVGASQSTLKHLAWLEPSLIFPGLLERIYPSLETLTETHRTSSALSILADISLPLFSRDHYPAGGKHLLPLLHLAIPGIDMNDPIKTISSLVFISTSLMSIPIVDMTQQPAQDDYYPTEMTEDPFAELSKESEDYLVRATTGEFEEWLAKFMRRVFTIFDNLPQENHKKQGGSSSSSSNNTMESGLTQMLLHTCDLIFGQLSDELYDMVLRLVVDFVSDRVLPNAVRAVGLLCDAITSVHPKKAAQVFIPLCISQIESELEHGACSTRSHSAASNLIQSDSTFHWYQNILFSVVSTLGPEVLVYKSELIAVTHTMVTHCYSRRGMMWTGKLIRNILKTVLDIYPKDFKSLNASQWKDKDFMNTQSHKIWGQPGDPANLEIQWHVPSEEEKNFALEFLDEFLTPSVTRLEEIMNSQPDQLMMESYALSNELCRRLAVIRNCLMGSSTMVADDGVEELPEDRERCAGDEDANVLEPTQKLQVGYTFTDTTDPRMAKARNVRKMIGELVHKLAIYFKTKREDDVESVKILIKIIRAYLSERGVERAQFDRSKSGYSYAKNIGKTPLCKKRYPRNLLVRRAYNHHLLRLRQNVQGRVRTPLHDDLITDLLDMSLGFYAEIRKQSQSALTATGRCFLGSKSIILPTLLKALSPSEDGTSDRMKGALYLFTHKSILLPCIRDWRFIPTFVETICGAQHQDKITIQELIRKVFRDYIHYFNAYSFHLIIPENLDALLTAVSPETIQKSDFESKVQTIESKVESRLHRQIESYHGLIEFLLDFMENSRVHWRFAFMAANFIQIFMRSNILKPSKKLATFVTKATLSEIPAMRRIGMSTTSQLLLYIKQRTFAKNDVDVLTRGEARNPLRMDVSVDSNNDQLGRELLEQSTQKLTPENAATSLLVDDPITGWYVWPEQYAAYKVNTSDNFIFSDIDQESLGAFDEFKEKFNSSDYWSKLCTYLSEEISQKQEDQFSSTFARLFNSIFQTYGDEPLATAKEHIERLAYASDQKNHQRAAAEILGGLIRGTKHWPIAKAAATWDWLIPLLRKVFVSITPDSLTYWESFVRFCSARRDPRRIQPLIDLVLEAELDPTSDAAFNESRKLLLSRTLVVKLQWRFNPWIEKILPSYLGNIQHPYKQVREVIGGNIDELVQIEWIPSVTSVQNLLKANASTDGVGNVPTQPTIPAQKERIEYIRKQLEMWFKEQSNTVVTGGISDYSHGSKTGKVQTHYICGRQNI
jgi:proteasome activator subunit 4